MLAYKLENVPVKHPVQTGDERLNSPWVLCADDFFVIRQRETYRIQDPVVFYRLFWVRL